MSPVDSSLIRDIDFRQKTFAEVIESAEKETLRVERETLRRRLVAYLLKTVALFGGIVVAARVLDAQYSSWVGFALVGAVTVDQLFSNHERLLVMTEARAAYRRLLRNIKHEYNQALEIERLTDDTEPAAQERAARKQARNLKAFTDRLHHEMEAVRGALDQADLRALRGLAPAAAAQTLPAPSLPSGSASSLAAPPKDEGA